MCLTGAMVAGSWKKTMTHATMPEYSAFTHVAIPMKEPK